jgi:capsular polysaccharide biosynthesis protein
MRLLGQSPNPEYRGGPLTFMVEGVPEAPVNVDLGAVARTAVGALLIAVPAALIAILVSFLRTPTYEAAAQVWVHLRQGDQQVNSLPDPYLLQTTTLKVIDTIDTCPVAKETKRRLDPPIDPAELLDELTVEQVQGTNLIRLTYKDTKPEKTQRIGGTLAEVSSERISETNAAGYDVRVTVYGEVSPPKTLADPKPLRSGILTLVVVWMLYAGVTLAMLVLLRR